MNRVIHCCSAVFLMIAVSACAQSNRATQDDLTGNGAGPVEVLGTRVALLDGDSCSAPQDKAIGGILLSLATSVAPKLIDHGLSWVGELLQQRVEEYNAATTSVTAGVFYGLERDGNDLNVFPAYDCVAIGYGRLQSGSDMSAVPGYPAELGFTSRPHVYLEANLIYQEERGTLYARLEPSILEFNRPLARRGETKDLVATYSFRFSTSGSAPDSSGSMTLMLPAFENLRPGTDLSGAAISSISTDWVPVPVPTPAVLAEVPEESTGMMPVSLLVTLTETEQGQGRQLFLRLSQVFDASKDDIAKALKAPLMPSEANSN